MHVTYTITYLTYILNIHALLQDQHAIEQGADPEANPEKALVPIEDTREQTTRGWLILAVWVNC